MNHILYDIPKLYSIKYDHGRDYSYCLVLVKVMAIKKDIKILTEQVKKRYGYIYDRTDYFEMISDTGGYLQFGGSFMYSDLGWDNFNTFKECYKEVAFNSLDTNEKKKCLKLYRDFANLEIDKALEE